MQFLYYLIAERLLLIRKDNITITLTLPENCKIFAEKYDSLQLAISQISVVDELLAGKHMCDLLTIH